MLLLGLPHGTLDLELLKRQHAVGSTRMAIVILVYLSLAAAMYAIWQAFPVAALIIFISIAIIHFSEDWQETGSAFLAQGVALAILTAPSFLHRGDMRELFVALSGVAEAAIVADLMLLLAPVSLAIAAIALVVLWQHERKALAAAGLAAIVGMALLPTAIGFAAFFCLFHSPRHFRAALAMVSPGRLQHVALIVSLLTMAALGLAAWLFAREVRVDAAAQWIVASFMTLSLLTVPHMAVPAILDFVDRPDADDRSVISAASTDRHRSVL